MNARLGGWGLFMLAGLMTADCHRQQELTTRVELRLSTDLPCSEVHGTTLTVGARGELEAAFPSASLTTCKPGENGSQLLGFVTLVPRGEPDEAFALKVVTAVSALSPDQCKPGDGSTRGYRGCIVARREFRYLPGHTLQLEVPMRRQCEGVECTTDSTCFDATTCMPAGVTCTKDACVVNDAPEVLFPNPAGPGSGDGGTAGVGGGTGGGGTTGGDGGSGGSAGGEGGQAGATGTGGDGNASGTGGSSGTSGKGGSGGTDGTGGPGGSGGIGGGGTLVSQVGAGWGHSCALVDESEVRCWGDNWYGQLGDGTTTGRPTPVPVRQLPGGPPLTGVQALALGYHHSCALLGGGLVECWGNNDDGQLGDGTTTRRLTPVPVLQSPGGPPLANVQALALGGYHSCALLSGSEVRCWGSNTSGELGDGTTTDRLTPVPVLQSPGGPQLSGVQALALGHAYSCALLSGGQVRCWGWNIYGQLGDGTTTNRFTPVPVLQSPGGPPLTGVQALALGGGHSCARLSGGYVQCWGNNEDGQLGDGTTTRRLTIVPVLQPEGEPLSGAQAISLGYDHSCARLSIGEVRCWGRNVSGQLGDGTTTGRPTPVPVLSSPDGSPLSGVQALALGGHDGCALRSGGDLRCWGSNEHGQLGDGTTTNQLTPVPVVFP